MSRPTFFRGALLALALALIGAMGYAGLSVLIGGALALRCVIVLLAGAYIVYLLRNSPDHRGRIAVCGLWLLVSGILFFAVPGLGATLVTQSILIWVVRALYHHARALPVLMDLSLTGFALGAAIWASTESGSVFITVWSFFLVQALFVWIPEGAAARRADPKVALSDRFTAASRTAEAAIRRLATDRH